MSIMVHKCAKKCTYIGTKHQLPTTTCIDTIVHASINFSQTPTTMRRDQFKQRWSLNLLVKQNKYPFLSQRFLFFQYTQEWISVTNDCQGFVCKGLWVVSTYIWKKGEQEWATPSHNNRMVVPKVRDYCLHWFSFWTSKRPTWILKAKSKWLF